VIPVYNEKNTVTALVDRVRRVNIDKEIILIDDGSTDGTSDIVKNMKGGDISLITMEKNTGKGAAVRKGIEQAKGDIILIQDADLEYFPEDYPILLEPILSGKADIVYGSRFLDQSLNSIPLNLFRMGGSFITKMTNFLYGINLTDEACCYKVFRSSVLKKIPLECRRFEFCPEVTAKVSRMGYKIHEVAVRYNPRTFKEGKKITYKDGFTALITLLKYKFFKLK